MTHWLQVGRMMDSKKTENAQWKNIQEYLNEYPESKATVYYKETGDVFCKIIKLECNQNYNNLDLDCNGGDRSVKHFEHKPSNIVLSKLQLDYFLNKIKNVEGGLNAI